MSNDTPPPSAFSGSENEAPVFAPGAFQPPQAPAPEPASSRPAEPAFVYHPRLRFQHVWWKHILLFVLTLVTTTLVGMDRYYSFVSDFGRVATEPSFRALLPYGFWYSGTILAILGAHEMGHYIACRIYRVDATLPYFIPMFIPVPGLQIGTLGAVIRIRESFPNRKILFDVGIAGPIAGFLLLVPALFIGMYLSTMTAMPDAPLTFIGKPLLFRAARWLVFGPVPEGSIVNLHPIVFAAWFGMLATALNLLPFGQLDGGHITYAAVGRLSTPISLATVAFAVAMTFITLTWLLMTVLMLVMLVLFGPGHPRVLDEHESIGSGRRALAIFALVMLVLCFTPIPFQFSIR